MSIPYNLMTPQEKAVYAREATARGMYLDLLEHGDVALLKLPAFDLLFITGRPAAKRAAGVIYVSRMLKNGERDWHRDMVRTVFGEANWQWCDQYELDQALVCKRSHTCTREHNSRCTRQHDPICKRRHVTGIKPKKLLDRSKPRRVVSAP